MILISAGFGQVSTREQEKCHSLPNQCSETQQLDARTSPSHKDMLAIVSGEFAPWVGCGFILRWPDSCESIRRFARIA